MSGLRLRLPWSRRSREGPRPATPEDPAEGPIGAPFPRPPIGLRHAWLDVTVARATRLGPMPLGRARIVVHAWPRGEDRPREAVARGATDAEGAVAFHLPVGRYALTATHGAQSRTVAVTVEHAGRATLLLEDRPRAQAHALRVEVVDDAGRPVPGVEVRAGEARASADAQGVAMLSLAPGVHEVRAAGEAVLVELAYDARLRVVARQPAREMDEDETLLHAPADRA